MLQNNPSIQIAYGLPLVAVILRHQDAELKLQRVILDTGSAATVFKTDDLGKIGIAPEVTDSIEVMFGIGGIERVLAKHIEEIRLGNLVVTNFKIQMGEVNYGIDVDGILGVDFLLKSNAIINFAQLIISK